MTGTSESPASAVIALAGDPSAFSVGLRALTEGDEVPADGTGRRPSDSWRLLRRWAEQRGWGTYRCAGAMLLAATPDERERLPSQQVLAGHWRRWLKGEHVPDAHMSDPNVRGFYRPIIARMLGIPVEKIWPAHGSSLGVTGRLKDERDRTAGALSAQRRKLGDLRRQIRLIPELEEAIAVLEDELRYLDAVLAVPVPPGRQGTKTVSRGGGSR